MEYRVLGGTGLKVSILSLGASPFGSVFGNVDEKECIETVHYALDMGINLIDVSPYYGSTKAEVILGKAIKTIQRDKFFLASKAGRYGFDEFDFSAKRIKASVEESLKRLNTDYLDIFQLHDIEFASMDQILEEGIYTLQQLKKQGTIRYFGVTGFPLNAFELLLENTQLDTILSYCRYTLINTSLLKILPLIKECNVGLINASPLCMGLLSDHGPNKLHPATAEIKETCRYAVQYCKHRSIDLAKLAIQFSVMNKEIPTTLVGMADRKTLKKNISYIKESIDAGLLAEVQHLVQSIQGKSWRVGRDEYY